MLARSLRAAMVSIRLELLLASNTTSGPIALFDPLVDLRTRVASFVVVFAVAVVFAAAGGVTGFLALAEVALRMGRTAIVLLAFEFMWSSFAAMDR